MPPSTPAKYSPDIIKIGVKTFVAFKRYKMGSRVLGIHELETFIAPLKKFPV